jgi:hypothetical protein
MTRSWLRSIGSGTIAAGAAAAASSSRRPDRLSRALSALRPLRIGKISGIWQRPERHRRPEPESANNNSAKKKQNLPMSKGLIWLMFHALQVRQGPMEN